MFATNTKIRKTRVREIPRNVEKIRGKLWQLGVSPGEPLVGRLTMNFVASECILINLTQPMQRPSSGLEQKHRHEGQKVLFSFFIPSLCWFKFPRSNLDAADSVAPDS